MSALNIAFAGTPRFALTALDKLLHEAFINVRLVMTQPEKKSGRGLHLNYSPIKLFASMHGLPVYTPARLDDAKIIANLRRYPIDILVVVAYGLILPPAILSWPRLGCLNIHASLLPRWRGAAPIHRALLAGDRTTGVSIMQLDEGLDTGPVWSQQSLAITATMTGSELHEQLSRLGANELVEVLNRWVSDPTAKPMPQAEEGLCYAHKCTNAERRIDWQQSAKEVAYVIRTFDRIPGAITTLEGRDCKLFGLRNYAEDGRYGQLPPGSIVFAEGNNAKHITVVCAQGGYIELGTVQFSGKKIMPAVEAFRGWRAQTETLRFGT